MPVSLAAALAAMLLAAEPAQSGPLLAQAMPRDLALGSAPSEQLSDATLNALPPPPEVVVRQTRYYGTVTIDHRAHLARRSPCVGCHGPGPVTKLEFTPKI